GDINSAFDERPEARRADRPASASVALRRARDARSQRGSAAVWRCRMTGRSLLAAAKRLLVAASLQVAAAPVLVLLLLPHLVLLLASPAALAQQQDPAAPGTEVASETETDAAADAEIESLIRLLEDDAARARL